MHDFWIEQAIILCAYAIINCVLTFAETWNLVLAELGAFYGDLFVLNLTILCIVQFLSFQVYLVDDWKKEGKLVVIVYAH